jgi:hypothetical protein
VEGLPVASLQDDVLGHGRPRGLRAGGRGHREGENRRAPDPERRERT